MNYKTATKFELNKWLAEAIDLKVAEYQNGEDYLITIETDCDDYPESIVDYCNNWNDIMPIAVELGDVTVSKSCASIHAHGDAYSVRSHYSESKPDGQRSLVICCIKVLEDK